MSIKKKILLSVSVMMIMLMAVVGGVAIFGGKPDVSAPTAPVKPVIKINQPTTYYYNPEDVTIVSGEDMINYTYIPDANAKSGGVVAYEYVIGNPNAEEVAVNLKDFDSSEVNIAYRWENEHIDNVTSGSDTYEMPRIAVGAKKHLYIIVSPKNAELPASFSSNLVWYYGKPGQVVFNIEGSDPITMEIVKGQAVAPLRASAGDGYTLKYYSDSNFSQPIDMTNYTSQGGTTIYVRAEQLGLTDDWFNYLDGFGYYRVVQGTTTLEELGLTDVVIPSTYTKDGVTAPVKSLDHYVFKDNTAITSITLPSSISSFSTQSFYNCPNLKTVTFEQNTEMTSIGDISGYGVFENCTSLTSINLEALDNLEIIYPYVFKGCSALTSITIPASVTEIDYHVFKGCTNLTSVIFEDTTWWRAERYQNGNNNVTHIDPTDLSNYTTAANLLVVAYQELDDEQYYYWYKSDEEPPKGDGNLPDSWIGYDSSKGVYYVQQGNTTDMSTALSNSNGQLIIPSTYTRDGVTANVTYIASVNQILNSTNTGTKITSLTIPDTITNIPSRAFNGQGDIATITIGSGLSDIGYGAFTGCANITSINISESNTYFTDYDANVIATTSTYSYYMDDNPANDDNKYHIAQNTLITGAKTTSTIPTGIEAIAPGAYNWHSNITSLTLPNTLKTIYPWSFPQTKGLTSIIIPSSVELIGVSAFTGSAIASVTFANPNGWFYTSDATSTTGGTSLMLFSTSDNATYLTSTYVSYRWYHIDSSLPDSWIGYDSANGVYYVQQGNTTDMSTALSNNDGQLIIPSTYTRDGVTANVTYITRINQILNSTNTGTKIKGLAIPDTITNIPSRAFNNQGEMATIAIGSGLSDIGYGAFTGCANITSINISESNTYFTDYDANVIATTSTYSYYMDDNPANDDNKYHIVQNTLITGAKTTSTIPTGIEAIAPGAYNWHSNITSLTLPNTLKTIYPWSFPQTKGLTSITIPYMVESIGTYAFTGSAITSVTFAHTGSIWDVGGTTLRINDASVNATNLVSTYASYTWNKINSGGSLPDSWIGYDSAKGVYYVQLGDTTEMSTALSNSNGQLIIPSTYTRDGVTANVTYIASVNQIFKSGNTGTKITSLTIPDTITNIPSRAFHDQSLMTTIIIGSGLSDIGYGAFSACTNITTINISDSNTYFTDYDANVIATTSTYSYYMDDNPANDDNKYHIVQNTLITGAKTTSTIPTGIEAIAPGAYNWHSTITSLTLPNTLKTIYPWAFPQTKGLTSITIPSRVESIGASAFYGSGITSATFANPAGWYYTSSDSSTTDGTALTLSSASSNATYLRSTYASYRWYRVDGNLPSDWYSLYESSPYHYQIVKGSSTLPSNLVIPSSYNGYPVWSIGESVFKGQKITSVSLPDHISIGNNAFRDCTSLKSVTFNGIQGYINGIGSSIFMNCNSLTTITHTGQAPSSGGYYVEGNAIITLYNNTLVAACNTTIIPNGVTTIGAGAFSWLRNMTTLHIPASVTLIEQKAFNSCDGITTITVDSANTIYKSVNDSAVVRIADNALVLGCVNTTLTGATISSIEPYAFYTLQKSFSLDFTALSTLETIKERAFFHATGLTRIYLPSEISKIEHEAFDYCLSLTHVYFDSSSRDYPWQAKLYDSSNAVTDKVYIDVATAPTENATLLKSDFMSYEWTNDLNKKIYTAYLDGTGYDTVEQANSAATYDGNTRFVYVPAVVNRVTAINNLDVSWYAQIVLLCTPYDGTGTPERPGTTAKFTAITYTTPGGVCTNRVRLSAGCTINVNSTPSYLSVDGELTCGWVGSNYMGQTGGKYAKLVLEENASIVVDGSGAGALYCTGYITEMTPNNGSSIRVVSGAIYQPFIINDYRGGKYALAAYNTKISPFNQFQMINISVQTTVEYGASLYGYINLYINEDISFNQIPFIGNNSTFVFQLADVSDYGSSYKSSVVFKYTPSDNKCTFNITGGATLNPISISYSETYFGMPISRTMSTENSYLSLSWFWDISLNPIDEFYGASYNFNNQKLRLMPGAKVSVAVYASVSFDEIVVLDSTFSEDIDVQPQLNYIGSNYGDAIFIAEAPVFTGNRILGNVYVCDEGSYLNTTTSITLNGTDTSTSMTVGYGEPTGSVLNLKLNTTTFDVESHLYAFTDRYHLETFIAGGAVLEMGELDSNSYMGIARTYTLSHNGIISWTY